MAARAGSRRSCFGRKKRYGFNTEGAEAEHRVHRDKQEGLAT